MPCCGTNQLLLGGLGGAFAADVGLALASRRAPRLPAWYLPLRTVLTAGAGASLGATLCDLEPDTCKNAWKMLDDPMRGFAAAGTFASEAVLATVKSVSAASGLAVEPKLAAEPKPAAKDDAGTDAGAASNDGKGKTEGRGLVRRLLGL